MKPLLVALSLALAALAIPDASAQGPALPEVPEKPLRCTSSGGDTDCRASAGPCEAHTHTYDVEDALNTYEASCLGCGVHVGGGDFVECEALAQLLAGPSAAPEPWQTHCWAMEDGSGCATTFRVGPVVCTYISGHWGGSPHASVECINQVTPGSCHAVLLPVPSAGCDGIPPSSAAAARPLVPCVDGTAVGCSATAGPCTVAAGASLIVTTAAGAAADCNLGLTRCHADAGVGQVLLPPDEPTVHCTLASAAAAPAPPRLDEVCQTGIAQTWCDFTVGPCFIRVVPWTAWGDVYVVMDCRGGGAGPTCHTEVHLQDPLDPVHYCAFSQQAPCTFSPPAHAGFDCQVGRVHCAFFIWVDLNPPNPTWDCL